MDEIGVKDTIAFRISDQIMSHIYPDQKFSEYDFLNVFHVFLKRDGNWEDLINGDPKQIELLMDSLKSMMKIKNNPEKYGIG